MVTITRKIEIIEKYFGKGRISSKGDDIAVCCPKCDNNKKKKLSISLIDNKFNCWVCGFSGKNIGKIIFKGNTDKEGVFGYFEESSEEEDSSDEDSE